jgi:hypothetical protein
VSYYSSASATSSTRPSSSSSLAKLWSSYSKSALADGPAGSLDGPAGSLSGAGDAGEGEKNNKISILYISYYNTILTFKYRNSWCSVGNTHALMQI